MFLCRNKSCHLSRSGHVTIQLFWKYTHWSTKYRGRGLSEKRMTCVPYPFATLRIHTHIFVPPPTTPVPLNSCCSPFSNILVHIAWLTLMRTRTTPVKSERDSAIREKRTPPPTWRGGAKDYTRCSCCSRRIATPRTCASFGNVGRMMFVYRFVRDPINVHCNFRWYKSSFLPLLGASTSSDVLETVTDREIEAGDQEARGRAGRSEIGEEPCLSNPRFELQRTVSPMLMIACESTK